MPVQDIDHGWKRILSETKSLTRQVIKVGIQSDAPPEPNGADMVTVAAVQEFGSPMHNIPSRPFMRTTADRTSATLPDLIEAQYTDLIAGSTAHKMLVQIGGWYQMQMKVTLLTGPWTPNAPRTIRKKGSDTPLVDTGLLQMSIRYELAQP